MVCIEIKHIRHCNQKDVVVFLGGNEREKKTILRMTLQGKVLLLHFSDLFVCLCTFLKPYFNHDTSYQCYEMLKLIQFYAIMFSVESNAYMF